MYWMLRKQKCGCCGKIFEIEGGHPIYSGDQYCPECLKNVSNPDGTVSSILLNKFRKKNI